MQRIRQINFFFKTIVFNRKLISLPKIQQLETTMLARDLIATVIKTFFEELDDVRDGKRQMNDESPYAGMYASYFNKDRDWFIQADTEEITTFFADDPIYKLEMLTELIYRDGMMLAASFNDAAAGGVRFGVVFAAFAALCAAQGNGIAAVVAAVALGAGRAIAGDGLALMGTLALCTLCGGALNGFNRMAVASGFVISAFSAAAYLGSEGAIGIFETAIAAVMFLVVPHRWLNFIRMRDEDRAGRKAQRTLEDMRDRLYMTAEVIEQLTRLYEEKEAVSPDKEAIGFARRQLASVSAVLKRTAEGERRRCYNFDVQVGAAGCAKFGSEETGDSMAVKELDSSILMMISDGMGTGAQARSESSAATELLTRLLSVGFELDEALECLNRILMAYNSGEDMYATLDALVFDRLNAGAKFVKFGAPPSYVIRSGKVHTLYSEALPAGILEQASPAVHSVNLKRGDTIVLMSDGTADALGSGLIATLAERVCSANTATDAAEAVLCAAREYGEDDDMSVMVARVS